MTALPVRQLYYHRDYDGVVAAAMVQASTHIDLDLRPIQYRPNLAWTSRHLAPHTGIVDFLYHPEATLWIDHHDTTFATEATQQTFRADAFHVFAPEAASCPGVIVELPWFERGERWNDYVRWANLIDGAAYESAVQANDLKNPHLVLSHVIAEVTDPHSLELVVRAVAQKPVGQVLELRDLQAPQARVMRDDARIRENLPKLLLVHGQVATLDQSDLPIPYRRYLAYERYPQIRYGIGLYRTEEATIVSVGENPWSRRGPVHLGQLCKEFGGGGRRSTAGVPVRSVDEARTLAALLTDRLNEALRSEKLPVVSRSGSNPTNAA